MARDEKNYFSLRGRRYQADAIAAIVQREDHVEVRYSDGTPTATLSNATVERVTYAIDKAKADADSP